MNFIVQYFLPLFYIVLLAWLLQRNKKLSTNGFPKWFIILFFLLKCFVGIAYNYIEIHYLPKGGDILLFSGDGLALYHSFLKDPVASFGELRAMFYFQEVDLMNSHSNFINCAFGVLKLIYFILDFFSFGNLFTDTILYNGLATLVFLRCWLFLKNNFFSTFVPGVWIYLMPSVFFYTSSVSKESVPYILISVLIMLAYKLSKSINVLYLVSFFLLFALLFIVKFLLAITFLGAIGLWLVIKKFPKLQFSIITLSVLFIVAAFFLSCLTGPKLNLAQYLVNRQQEFMALEANSKIPIAILKPNFYSFLNALPTALKNVFFKPLPGEGGKTLYLMFSLEILSFWILFLFLWIKNKFKFNFSAISPLVWSLFLFAIANLLVIGFVVPNIGAITRYRSIFLPFIGLFLGTALSGNESKKNATA